MTLFKPKSLPIVLEDIATSIQRASRNSTTAIALLDDFLRIEPPGFTLEALVSGFSRDVFRLREDCYPAGEIAQLLKTVGTTNEGECHEYWSFYTYLFSLFRLIELPRVGNFTLDSRRISPTG